MSTRKLSLASACILSLISSVVQAQVSSLDEKSAIERATSLVEPAPYLTKTVRASLGERLAALEERVLGLEHPIYSLLYRTEALEQDVFGWPPGSQTRTETVLPERIASLEAAVFANAKMEQQSLPDGMSTYVENTHQKHALLHHPLSLANHTTKTVSTTNIPLVDLIPQANNSTPSVSQISTPHAVPHSTANIQPSFVNLYATPGKYLGFPYVYRGPGLPPEAYGAYPGSPTWFESPYRQSGALFYTNTPYFPAGADRNFPATGKGLR